VPASNTVDKLPRPPTSTLPLEALMNQETLNIIVLFIPSVLCRIESGSSLMGCIHFHLAIVVFISFCIKTHYVKNACDGHSTKVDPQLT
jgi:hypothetical protein